MNITRAGHMLATGAVFTLTEASEAAKNDPALAMRIAATSLSDTLLNKVNPEIKDSFQATVVPVVRGGILALNAVKLGQTFKDPEATKFDKFMDIGRVASDLVGFAGGLAVILSPEHAQIGRNLMGFSYAVDAVSHAYRGLNHGAKRVAVWQTKLDAAKQAEREREAQEQDKGKGHPCPPAQPQEPSQPKPPADIEQVQVCIKGSASAAAAFLRGGHNSKPMLAVAQ
jgi:hypothetical protein